MIPLLGFAPDADHATPGAILDAGNLIPTDRGMRGAPTQVNVGKDALGAACRGAAVLKNLSGTSRVLAGDASAVYETSGTAWASVSTAMTYALGTDDRYSFCQFGNAALIAAPTQRIARSLSGGFAEITAAPKAMVIESLNGFVMALRTNESVYGDSQDRWWCSAYLDDTDWAPAVATQCTTGRIVEGGGPLTAGKRLNDDMVAFKKRAMFLGRYQGPPTVWKWDQVSNDIGCVGLEAVINIGTSLMFVGTDDCYLYDGTKPVSAMQGRVREYFQKNLDQYYSYRCKLLWDRRNALAWLFYPSTSGAGAVDACLVYHARSGRWGPAHQTVEAVVNYVSGGITYDGGIVGVTTYDSGPSIPFDSPYWLTSAEVPGVFNSSHALCVLNGVTGASYLITNAFGDEDQYTFCDGLKARALQTASSSTATGYTVDELGTTYATGSSQVKSDGAYDLRQTARFHKFRIDYTGDHEVVAVRPSLRPAGRR